jgi:Siphovirus Gp157
MLRINDAIIKQQLERLKLEFPDLIEDLDSWELSIESETDMVTFMRSLERQRQDTAGRVVGIEQTIDNLMARKERFQRNDAAMRSMMLGLLQNAQLRKMDLPEATISVRHGVPRVVITDEADLPGEYWRIKKEPDKTKIKQALESAASVPGASLSNSPDTITIRIR